MFTDNVPSFASIVMTGYPHLSNSTRLFASEIELTRKGIAMISFEKAVSLAKKCWDEVDYVTEYPEAYSFSKFGDMSIGGNGPVVVLKADGRCINFVDFLECGEFDIGAIRDGYIAEFNG